MFISIPSGTIKSIVNEKDGQIAPKFQFLLVRLKDQQIALFDLDNLISIPSGTIKRSNRRKALMISSLFQFLLVRLKERFK